MVSFKLEIKEGQAELALVRVRDFIDHFCGPMSSLCSLVTEGDKLCIGIALPMLTPYVDGDFIQPYEDIIKRVQAELKVD